MLAEQLFITKKLRPTSRDGQKKEQWDGREDGVCGGEVMEGASNKGEIAAKEKGSSWWFERSMA